MSQEAPFTDYEAVHIAQMLKEACAAELKDWLSANMNIRIDYCRKELHG